MQRDHVPLSAQPHQPNSASRRAVWELASRRAAFILPGCLPQGARSLGSPCASFSTIMCLFQHNMLPAGASCLSPSCSRRAILHASRRAAFGTGILFSPLSHHHLFITAHLLPQPISYHSSSLITAHLLPQLISYCSSSLITAHLLLQLISHHSSSLIVVHLLSQLISYCSSSLTTTHLLSQLISYHSSSLTIAHLSS